MQKMWRRMASETNQAMGWDTPKDVIEDLPDYQSSKQMILVFHSTPSLDATSQPA
jgi:hypothetical protein